MINLDQIFNALSDSTRRAILTQLARHESSVSEIAEPFTISLPAISRHLHVLEQAGLIGRKRKGRRFVLHLEAAAMREAGEWMARYRGFWEPKPAKSGRLSGT